jgi:hypothetical protein
MITAEAHIRPFLRLGRQLRQPDIVRQRFGEAIRIQHQRNPWFTPECCEQAIQKIALLLEEEAIRTLLERHPALPHSTPQTIALMAAGDMPLQAFPDLLHILLAGHRLQCRQAPDDNLLLPIIVQMLTETDPAWAQHIRITDKITDADAVIADVNPEQLDTFNQYFKGKPHLLRIRKGRTLILTGKEDVLALCQIAHDICTYFGRGPEAIRKLIVPQGYDFQPLFQQLQEASIPLTTHNRFLNHLEYQKAIHLMGRQSYLDAGTFLFRENDNDFPPVAVVHYAYYTNEPPIQANPTEDTLTFLEHLV